MMIKDKIESILADICAVLPDNVQHLRHDFEKNLRATLNMTFAKMELVTREEFDIQATLLKRTRARLDELEAMLAEIEKTVSDKKR